MKGTGFKRLSESNSFGVPNKPATLKKSSVSVLGAVEQSYGIYQTPSFRSLVTTMWNDPLLVRTAMLFSQQVVARSVFYTASADYPLVLNGKTALQTIQEWCDKNNIDVKIFEIALEQFAFGNSFWRITDLGFVKIPIEAVWHAVRVSPNIPLQEKYNIQLVPIYGAKLIPYNEFVHFRIFTTGYHAPLGQGILQSLLANPVDSSGALSPSIYDIRLGMRTSLHEGFRKFSFGNELWCFEGMSNEDFLAEDAGGKSLGERIADMSTTGNRIATNAKGNISLAVPERTQSYDQFIKEMRNEFHMALGEPSLKLGLEEGFTKSTAESATDIHQLEISYCRQNLKEVFGDLFKVILDKLGFDGEKADVQLNFGIEEIAEYKIEDIFAAEDKGIILKDEARKLLNKYHKWDIVGNIKGGDKPKEESKVMPITKNSKVSTAKVPIGKEEPNKAKETDSISIPDPKSPEEQLSVGIQVEMEHTTDKEEAEKIAKDHLNEIPDYYTRLIKMEREAKKEKGSK